jgi:hypothetical protein
MSVDLAPGTCTMTDLGNACGLTYATTATTSQPQGGSCAPGAVNKSLQPATWNQVAQACTSSATPTQGACSVGALCAPLPDPGYHVCIMSNFDLPCPSGAYSTKRTTYASESDLRGCSACTCGAVTGATCDGFIYLYPTTTNCTGGQLANLTTSCTPLTMPRYMALFTPAAMGGSCAGTTSPIGSATPTQPTTFCCID